MRIVKMKRGFSLMELLVVIFIVSLVYFLGFEGFSISDISHTKKTPLDYIKLINQQQRKGKLICINNCKTCFFKDSLSAEAVAFKEKFDFGQDVVIYKLNQEEDLKKVEFGRYNDNKICLIVDYYANGSHSPFVLQNKTKIYLISSFFNDVKEVESLNQAKALWQGDIRALHNGDFY